MELIDVKSFVADWKNSIKEKIISNDIHPILNIVQVGDNPASNSYIKGKLKDCEEVGISTWLYQYPEEIEEEEFIDEINYIQRMGKKSGIIVQLPLPKHISVKKVNELISPKCDVDGFTSGSPFTPCTPLGVLKLLEYELKKKNDTLDGKNVVIIGRSDIVGKPMARLLTDNNATVTLCHSHTRLLHQHTRYADIIIVAVGKPNFLKSYHVNNNTIVVDVGINSINGHLVGDVDIEDFKKANDDSVGIYDNIRITPVPGGVGLLTRCALLDNVVTATINNKGN